MFNALSYPVEICHWVKSRESCPDCEVNQLNVQDLTWYEKIVSMAESGQAKKHVFGNDGMVAGMGCQTLARASEVLV